MHQEKLRRPKVCLIIPALNESSAIGKVIDDIPKELVEKIIVVDNGSADNTSNVAKTHGAIVILESRRGYGNACLAGISFLEKLPPEIVVFIDGDYSSDPKEIDKVLMPIIKDEADLAIGCRASSKMEKGSMPLHARLGNWFALNLIKIIYKHSFSDLGPFRAIKWENLKNLKMKSPTYGWTVEMMVKALRKKMRIAEVEVSYRKRIGKSKISGTVTGTMKAGYNIVATIIRHSTR
ncbi:glycosyltransferase family 2 protein [[Eubacterium] cellulosolvens]